MPIFCVPILNYLLWPIYWLIIVTADSWRWIWPNLCKMRLLFSHFCDFLEMTHSLMEHIAIDEIQQQLCRTTQRPTCMGLRVQLYSLFNNINENYSVIGLRLFRTNLQNNSETNKKLSYRRETALQPVINFGKNISAKSVHLTLLYVTSLTSTNHHFTVLWHHLCT